MALDFVSPTDQPLAEEARFSWSDAYQKHSYLGLLGLVSLLIYSYWNTLELTSRAWANDQYSHGYLMPFIAIYLLWSMRPNPAAQQPAEGAPEETFFGVMPASMLLKIGLGVAVASFAGYLVTGDNGLDDQATLMGSLAGVGMAVSVILCLGYVMIGQAYQAVPSLHRWAGFAILLASAGVRYYGASIFSQPINRFSLLIALTGTFLLIGGSSLLRWTVAGIGFLVFMFPLPTVVEDRLLLFLQRLATMASEFVLTIINQPVARVGNKLVIDGLPLEVAEACSGLRMLTIFSGLAVAFALFIKRPWWDRLIVLLSGVPIALTANITRIIITALLFRVFPEGEWIHTIIHDYAGFAMMFIALGLLYLELRVLSALSTEEEDITGYGGGSLGHLGSSPGV